MEQIGNQIPNKVTGDKLTANEVNILKNKADEIVNDINEKTTLIETLETSVENIKRPGEVAFSEAIPFTLPSAKTSINVIQDYTLSLGAEAVADSFHTIKTTGNGINTITFPSSWINGNGGSFKPDMVQRIILYFDGDYVTYTITDLAEAGVIDDVQPTVTITSTVSGTTSETSIPLVITLSEPSSDFAASDIVVEKGTISGFAGSGMNYTANVIPNEVGLVTVNIPSGSFTDAEGNPNVASSQFSVIYEEADTTKPTITISSTESGTTGVSPIPLTFTLSEISTDFTSGDVVVTNGILQNFAGSGVNYTADLVPTAPGIITVNVLADSFTDAAGNGNIVATEFSITYEELTGIMADANLVEWWDSFEGVTTNDTAPVTVSSWAGKKSATVLSNGTKADQPEYAAGIIDFSGTTKKMQSSSAVFDISDSDWTIAGRISLSSGAVSQHILGKWNNTTGAGTKAYLFGINASGQFTFYVSADGSAAVNLVSTVPFVASNEYTFFLRHDAINNTISIKVNNETPVSLAHSAGVISLPGTTFTIGGSFGATGIFGNASTINSEMDLVIFNKVLTNQEMIDYATELVS